MAAEFLHLGCPHCHITNRVKHADLSQQPECGQCHQALFMNGREIARQPGAMGKTDIVRWTQAQLSKLP